MGSFIYKTFRALAVISLLFLPAFVSANTLGLSPDSGSYSVGKTFPVTVFVSSVSQAVNAVSGTITFPTDKLQVVSVSKAGSVLTLWVQEPTFSNGAGTVSFEGVVPNPGFTGSVGSLLIINFKVVGPGSATVKWASGTELANDGNGTNIIKNLNSATFSLGGAPAPVVAPVATPVPSQDGAIKVTSETYPDSKKWYTTTTGKFSWNLSEDVSAVKILVGKLSNSSPVVVYDPPIETKTVPDINDGVWYFHLQAKDSNGWGPITHFAFRVDSTPPESFKIKQLDSSDPTDPHPSFSFDAVDSTSGIDHYSIEIDSNQAFNWDDNGNGIFKPDAIGPGSHTLLAKAYDAAGNSIPASIDFRIEGIEKPKITSYTDSVPAKGNIVVHGTALANIKVEVSLKKGSGAPLLQSTNADENGDWSIAIDSSNLPSGAYSLTAKAIDSRGAQSESTAPKTVLVDSGWFTALASSALKFLAILVPLLALLFALFIIFTRGFHHVKTSNQKYRKELQDIERLVDKAFVLLKEDVEDSIHLLERTKSRRKLTAEEDAIIIRLRQNLREAEKIIHKEVQNAERDLG